MGVSKEENRKYFNKIVSKYESLGRSVGSIYQAGIWSPVNVFDNNKVMLNSAFLHMRRKTLMAYVEPLWVAEENRNKIFSFLNICGLIRI